MFRWYRSDPSHVVFVKEIEVRPDLTFEEEPVQILDCDIKVLKRKPIPFYGGIMALKKPRRDLRTRCVSSILICSDQKEPTGLSDKGIDVLENVLAVVVVGGIARLVIVFIKMISGVFPKCEKLSFSEGCKWPMSTPHGCVADRVDGRVQDTAMWSTKAWPSQHTAVRWLECGRVGHTG
ncbi:ABC transporter G family member 33-like [Gossypium australe]|uniref:ABC transporter G family member 33-like n=1 Tax=Gossypium australe TaxID=47621 RepID=A0A5B6VW32_9ROSI|nr:ABC transporter G family member 33-like [Gossypium australe]